MGGLVAAVAETASCLLCCPAGLEESVCNLAEVNMTLAVSMTALRILFRARLV